MKVEATKVGFYGKLRAIGEQFEIESKKDLGSWMVQIKPKARPKQS